MHPIIIFLSVFIIVLSIVHIIRGYNKPTLPEILDHFNPETWTPDKPWKDK